MRYAWTLPPLLLTIAGCGGSDAVGCPAGLYTMSNAAYAGSYTGYFTPGLESTLSEVTESFDLTVAGDGKITGTVFDAHAQSASTVTGTVGDLFNGCDTSRATLVLTFTPTGGQAETLTVSKRRNRSLPGSYGGTLTTGGVTPESGDLVVAETARPNATPPAPSRA